jgi:hypothetical protein
MITDEIVRQAADAYDAARCRSHGQSVEVAGMSEKNKEFIAPMIRAALEVAAAAERARWIALIQEWRRDALMPEEMARELGLYSR